MKRINEFLFIFLYVALGTLMKTRINRSNKVVDKIEWNST